MTPTLFFFLTIVAALLAVLIWSLARPTDRKRPHLLGSLEQGDRHHSTYLALVRQALSPIDIGFLQKNGSPGLARRVRKERRRVVLSYLGCLREDHLRLLSLAKLVSALSPEVASRQELERVWLTLQFSLRYQMLRAEIHLGSIPVAKLDGLSQLVSDLAVRVESAMTELGERAALASKLASSLHGNGVDVG
jgi:predicted small integral membrane protein